MKPTQLLASTLITGSVASVVSTVTLAALAKMEGKPAAQPLNSTSHWFYGDNAARVGGVDAAHTGIGLATHHASALFWALPFETCLAVRPPQSSIELLRDAAVMSAIAAVVDYGITPKQFTPGWELTLSRQSMAGAFAGLALGLAAGAYVSRWVRQTDALRRCIRRLGIFRNDLDH
jgi:NOL1/NOP2/fmu family ribosome biogenesis protein